jgi:hypothetical protein
VRCDFEDECGFWIVVGFFFMEFVVALLGSGGLSSCNVDFGEDECVDDRPS